jgi:hypothetical protein
MDIEKDIETLQLAIQHYRSKCSQLEYEFLLYKIKTEQFLNRLQSNSTEEKVSDRTDD